MVFVTRGVTGRVPNRQPNTVHVFINSQNFVSDLNISEIHLNFKKS
jgi:ribosomal protein L21E